VIWALALPNLIAAVLMILDEVFFHRRRGLPKWERIGHPLDTLTLLVCYAVAIFVKADWYPLVIYTVLGIFSCVFITKDETIHTEHCDAKENHLHALLFVVHPFLLISIFVLWFFPNIGGATHLLWAQAALTLLFGIYQLIYWNFFYAERK